MRIARSSHVIACAAVVAAGAGFACRQPAEEAGAPQPAEIPITTSSEEAREEFVTGRDLSERLRGTDAHAHFVRAVELDPGFAWAHLQAGFTGSTNQEFFDSLERALALTGEVSEGERLLILATEAGTDGEPEAQRRYLGELVEKYPADHRAHNALGAFHFGRQEYGEAIGHYQKAIEIDPDYSPPYNQKGYAHRFLGDYEAAEAAFQRYIELIPDDPNPYDSYAELLMKTGRFEESIDNYRKALAADPYFIASYSGIAHNQAFQGEYDAARETLAELRGRARNVGEERAALFWTTVVNAHQGDYEAAMASCAEMRSLAEAGSDWAAVAGDLNLMGDLQLQAGRLEEASASYAASMEAIARAEVRDQVKENANRNILYDETRVLLAGGDLEAARARGAAYGEAVAARGIPFEVRQHHELLGMLALAEGDPAGAVEQLAQANQQNPRVLLLQAKAWRAQNELARARELAERAANFNSLGMTYAYARAEARRFLDTL